MPNQLHNSVKSLQVQINDIRREVAALEAEREYLTESPVRFDCWKDAALVALDYAPSRQLKAMRRQPHCQKTGQIQSLDRTDISLRSIAEWAKCIADQALSLQSRGIGTLSQNRGSDHFGPRQALERALEQSRPGWPSDGDCGPPAAERHCRLKQIDLDIARLTAKMRQEISNLGGTATTHLGRNESPDPLHKEELP